MNLMQLYYFRTLAKLEHYSYAAAELGISQSALSQSMSALERELGHYLFEKKGRNITLSHSGNIFLQYVDAALKSIDAGRQELDSMYAAKTGKISLGVISGVAHFLPSVMSAFLKTYESAALSCNFGTTESLLNDLKQERSDLVICSKRDNEQGIKFVPILEGQLVVLFPLGHVLCRKKEIFLKDIAPHPFIIHTRESGMRKVTEELFAKHGLSPQIVLEAEDDMLIAKMVESNHGVAIITNMPEIKKCRIKAVPLADNDAERPIYLAFQNGRALPDAVRAFKSFLLEKQDLQQMFDASCNVGRV